MRVLIDAPGFVVIDKPSGLSVHRGWDASSDTLMRRLRDARGHHVYPVHRLDRATSGAVVIALDRETAARLAESFREHAVRKEYLALVRGVLEGAGTIDHPIASEDDRERKPAITEYEAIAVARDRYTLVRAWPRTGRQHQLRRHFKHLSRPLLGDTTYGDGRENRALRAGVGLMRLALHARVLDFADPRDASARVRAIAPLPVDLRAPLERLGFDPALLDALDRDAADSIVEAR